MHALQINSYIIYCACACAPSGCWPVSGLSAIATSRLSNWNCLNKRCQKIKTNELLKAEHTSARPLCPLPKPPLTCQFVGILSALWRRCLRLFFSINYTCRLLKRYEQILNTNRKSRNWSKAPRTTVLAKRTTWRLNNSKRDQNKYLSSWCMINR